MPKTHRRSRTPLWWIWCAIKQRCTNPRCKDYPDYGGRGITLCGEWSASFEAFIADVGERPSDEHSIDRIDNDRGYEPGNVRWSTGIEQARNRRRRTAGTYATGERNGGARLTAELVTEIRVRHAGGDSFGSLARELGVARSTVTRACRGESWRSS